MMLEAGTELLPDHRFRAWWLEHEGTVITCCIFVAAGREVAALELRLGPGVGRLLAGAPGLWSPGSARGFAGASGGSTSARTSSCTRPRLADRNDPIAWERLYPRDSRYPLVLALTMPERLRRAAGRAARRLPAPIAHRLAAARGRATEGLRRRRAARSSL